MTFDLSSAHKQAINFSQINQIFKKAYKKIEVAKRILDIDAESCFISSYESMLQTSLALMLSTGYRPNVQLGHHRTLVDYSKYILGQKFNEVTATYNRMRQKRNKLLYDVSAVSQTEAVQAIKSAEKYFTIIEQKITEQNPQQKLWKP